MSDAANTYDRRSLLRLGGLAAATAAIAAACNEEVGGDVGRVGIGDTAPELEDPIINNGVLMRTAASHEYSIVAAYQRMIDDGLLSAASPTFPDLADQTALVTTFLEHHADAAATFDDLAVGAGEAAIGCANVRLDTVSIDPIFVRTFEGQAATDTTTEIPPSDDATRDMLNLVYSLESLSATTCQALVAQVSEPALRAALMQVGVRSARQAATLSLQLNPGGYVSTTDASNAQPSVTTTTIAPTTTAQDIATPDGTDAAEEPAPTPTDIPLPVAVPSQYGSLAPTVYVGGHGDENGVRQKVSFESPSLNNLTYPFTTCEG